MIDFGKVATAMVTPFDHKGNIDFEKTTQLINYLISNGSDALVIAGTTGESPTLSTEEKLALFRHSVKVVDGRVPVVAGTGSNNTYASIELTKKAEEIGVDAIMIVAPYYNKPNQEGLYQHFKTIAESTELPVMLYNIPGRSVINMSVDTIVRLAELPNVVALKDASGDLDAMTAIIAQTSDDFALYSGDDGLTLPVLAIGGTGIISVASHVIGNEMQEMVKLYESGNPKEAAKIHQRIVPVMKSLFAAPSPTPVKTALQLKGLDVGSVRLPLVPLTEEERQTLVSTLNTL
ncbi:MULTISPECIES: 4-hydroxy-tetrahydrodipicolinate synthase [Priestia]|jgi:4-hydroxy-tetrahydrodipicolinate synthase|uniref:4-hydroxy-tetrahydrodipicolinate synthase n=4 Tax=Priestia TaxID=2800373 RepID=D5DQ48_PRIM1|nr:MULTISPECIES: 4-hydroxy-tetrahydrodipicolinate synthase [Priestia]KOP76126.1 dihydrodipicolinate synthase [Bacillus sp. FJAT-21351]MBK0295290.1 4-hydroxy-tetrahydrodipicolinate synthase [Bacillus sp. S34]MBZ5478363.1 4-hydroxy-tetrahydrodipicolinate synthase [Bacillus sp. T_4]MCJ7984798.1 4-hydroxy-tetrahydrodipicolinate synthase [Priestia sp. OVL9]MCL9636343.1 4-hydroxy-tetrahydrodipicolinate synthase [Bacillus zanthoxyli]MDP9577051.1 4-hydroxy-tetrahydrodipicolinate synthase [Bacillus sp